ncbi:MAG: ABC transporter substrate-binding protein [Candidatus Pacebacteria bacterium]|nr:ABC transporter substrate-binding protein [Candidatus Paceibacterota bacterium]
MDSKNAKFIFRKFYLPKLEKIGNLLGTFSLTEKVIFWFFVFVLFISTFLMLKEINKNFFVEVPKSGGEIIEGLIGSPRFINPLLAISNTDRDLTALVYSGLLKATPDGKVVPDLAENYEISEDGLIYTVTLKEDASFHDGVSVTTEDIAYTVRMSLDNIIKSPKRPNWEGVEVKIIDQKQIQFILKTPYSPFTENLTLGILPKHIWEKVEPEQFAFSQLNIKPIGSGPYRIVSTKMNSSGIMEKYELKPFTKYTLGEPYISKITIKFYPNEEALINAYKKGYIEDINTISPEQARELEKNGSRVENVPLPRIFGVFFNQNQNAVFTNSEVRKALNKAVDRERIVREVLSGFGTPIYGPVPTTSQYFNEDIEGEFNLQEAIELLENNGWEINEETKIREKTIKKVKTSLEFELATSDAPELKAVANIVKENWESVGAKVTVKIFEIGDLNQNIIRPRKYDALLFGEIIGRDMDLFAFWHSSQRNDPGLNIASYANANSDKLLEQVRSSRNEEDRIEKFFKFQENIQSDIPAVFIYSPDFIYITSNKIKGMNLGQITLPSERFFGVHSWFIETEDIWKIFSK